MSNTSGLFKIVGCDSPDRRGDVIFVHGLGGHPRRTWHPQEKDDDNFWPAWLGKDFPDVGIWSLGYEAEPSKWKGHTMPLADRATNILDLLESYEIGNRPIIFIAHSLGGLLVKQLLRNANDFGECSSIISETKGIVFLSTPHSGSDMASWIRYIGGILRTTISVQELEAHHPHLRYLNLWYRNNKPFNQIPILNYCETIPTHGILVVNQTSADPGIPGVTTTPMDFNHITICKLESKDSQIYLKVKQLIKKKLTSLLIPLPMELTKGYGQNFQRLDETGQTKLPRIDWKDAPDTLSFFGREKELADLAQWILQDKCRLVAIVGIGGIGKTKLSTKLGKGEIDKTDLPIKLGEGGIGKTDLSVKLAKGIQNEFEYVIWRSLLDAPPITNILSELIKFLSNEQEIDFSDRVDSQISRLLHYLSQHRCLLILDNIEGILKSGGSAGEYIEGYQQYGELFQKIAEVSHLSCLLLTSREKPSRISNLEGRNSPVRFLELGGLDVLEGRKIFEDISEFSGSNKDWEELIEFYNGNPLALKLAAKHIEEAYFGKISTFLEEGKPIFKDIDDLLKWYFERFSEQEKEILYWLAINREPVTYEELREDILSEGVKNNLRDTLRSLQRRLLLDKNQSRETFALQPVILEYITKQFIENVTKEIETGKIELFNSHSLYKALAKDYIRLRQKNLIMQPVIVNLIDILDGKNNLEARLIFVLCNSRTKSVQKRGYTGGNILNILCELKSNISNRDFSQITIRQAYLTDTVLHNINFSDSSFFKSVFKETFGAIESISFSRTNNIVAMSGDANGNIYLWDIFKNQKLVTCSGHTKWVRSISFSPNGETLASSSDDYNVKLWNVDNGECLHTLEGHTNRVLSTVFSPDGQTLASGSADGTVKLWNPNTGENIETFQVSNEWVRAIAFSCNLLPEGQILASGSGDGMIKLWNITTGKFIKGFKAHDSYIWSIDFSPISQVVASGGEDKIIRLWDIKTEKCLQELNGHSGRVHSVSFNRNGQKIASCSQDKTVRLWDVQTGEHLKILNEHLGRVKSVDFDRHGDFLISGDENKTVKLWSVEQGNSIKTLQGYSNSIRSIVFSKDGRFLIFGGDDQSIQAWDFEKNRYKEILNNPNNLVWSIAFNSDGKTLASTKGYQSVNLYDVSLGKNQRDLDEHTGFVWSVAFSPDGKTLASGSADQSVKLWNIANGRCYQTLKEHKNWVWSVVFSPDGNIVASASTDRNIKLWDFQTGECLKTLDEHTGEVWSVAFSYDQQILASSSEDKTIRLWDINSGKCLKKLEGHTSSIWSVAFSPNGKTLASGSSDKTVRIWDIQSGECLKILPDHTNSIRSIAFRPHTEILASGSEDATIKMWNIQTGECIKTLRPPKPYEGINITGITGLTESQKTNLKALGAVEHELDS